MFANNNTQNRQTSFVFVTALKATQATLTFTTIT